VAVTRIAFGLAFLLAAQPRGLSAQEYTVAFNSFAPGDTDIFVADADGGNARPLFADPALDYNASFSADCEWVLFTAAPGGSADIDGTSADGSRRARLVEHHAFHDLPYVARAAVGERRA
jgi:Tol biopolymer transport system component